VVWPSIGWKCADLAPNKMSPPSERNTTEAQMWARCRFTRPRTRLIDAAAMNACSLQQESEGRADLHSTFIRRTVEVEVAFFGFKNGTPPI
jgi:hypothetical protein